MSHGTACLDDAQVCLNTDVLDVMLKVLRMAVLVSEKIVKVRIGPDAKKSSSRNLRTGVDPTGEEPGRPRGKGAWAGRAGQELSIPEMKESVQERSGGVDIGGQLRQMDENAKTRKLGVLLL